MPLEESLKTKRRATVLEEKRHVSSKISETSRYIGFGLVAVVYAVLTSDSAFMEAIAAEHHSELLIAATLGGLTVVLDYLQFIGGYISVNAALNNVAGDYRYNKKAFFYRLRVASFWMKQITALAGSIIFCIEIVVAAL